MMSVETHMAEVSTSVKEREKQIRELGKAVAAKGKQQPSPWLAFFVCFDYELGQIYNHRGILVT